MRARWMAALVLLWPVMASAASCEDAKDTAEINECLHNEVEKAEVEMAKYLKASRERLAEHPDSIVTMELAQSAGCVTGTVTAWRSTICGRRATPVARCSAVVCLSRPSGAPTISGRFT